MGREYRDKFEYRMPWWALWIERWGALTILLIVIAFCMFSACWIMLYELELPVRYGAIIPIASRRLGRRMRRDLAPYGLGHWSLSRWRQESPAIRQVAICYVVWMLAGRL